MNKKEKLQALYSKLQALQNKESFDNDIKSLVKDQVLEFAKEVKNNPTIKLLTKITDEINKFKKEFDSTEIIQAIKAVESEFETNQKQLIAEFEDKINAIEIPDQFDPSNLVKQITDLRSEFDFRILNLPIENLRPDIENIQSQLQTLVENGVESSKRFKDEIEEIKTKVNKLASLGGGSMPFQVNANSSVISTRYADINFVSDTAIRWSATNDDTNKRVNIRASVISGGSGGSALTVKEADGSPSVSNVNTIVVSNGTLTDDGGGQVTVTTGGGGGGLTRTTSVLSVSSTMAAAGSTDYVFFPNVGIALTLPTAINNSNLYTVKNFSASSVVVLAATGQDIDGSTSALLPTLNESLSFISNGSVWGVV